MANTTISKHARQAARKAAAAAAEEQAKRQRANVEDLSRYFNAAERADGVDEWLHERQEALLAQARQRRAEFVRDAGHALRSMRDRGESLREVATMTGLTEKAVRDAIRDAEAIDEDIAEAGTEAMELAGVRAGEAEGRSSATVVVEPSTSPAVPRQIREPDAAEPAAS